MGVMASHAVAIGYCLVLRLFPAHFNIMAFLAKGSLRVFQ